jgi:hypothetical protein
VVLRGEAHVAAGTEFAFDLFAKDVFGNQRVVGGDAFVVSLRGPEEVRAGSRPASCWCLMRR